MPSITSPPPTTSSPYPSTADTTLASRQPRSDPADPRRTSRRTGRHGPAHGHLAPDRQRADPNSRTERSAAVGMPRQAVVERPDGTTSWAGCTGGPSGLGAPATRPGWVHRSPRPAALSSVDRVRQGCQRVRRRALAGRDGRAARPAPAAGGPALAGRRTTGGCGSAVVGGVAAASDHPPTADGDGAGRGRAGGVGAANVYFS